MAENKANWQEIDPVSLGETINDAYLAYKAAYRASKAARERFEAMTREAAASTLPADKRVVFGYNYGKLSMAVVDAEAEKVSKPKASRSSLASFLGSQGYVGGASLG